MHQGPSGVGQYTHSYQGGYSCSGLKDTGNKSCMAWSEDNSFFGFLRVGETFAILGSGFDPSMHLLVGEVSVDNCSTPTYLAVKYKSFENRPISPRDNSLLT